VTSSWLNVNVRPSPYLGAPWVSAAGPARRDESIVDSRCRRWSRRTQVGAKQVQVGEDHRLKYSVQSCARSRLPPLFFTLSAPLSLFQNHHLLLTWALHTLWQRFLSRVHGRRHRSIFRHKYNWVSTKNKNICRILVLFFPNYIVRNWVLHVTICIFHFYFSKISSGEKPWTPYWTKSHQWTMKTRKFYPRAPI